MAGLLLHLLSKQDNKTFACLQVENILPISVHVFIMNFINSWMHIFIVEHLERLAHLFPSVHNSYQQPHCVFEAMLTKAFCFVFLCSYHATILTGRCWMASIFFYQLKEEWRRLRHTLSRPQVGVDNLDKYARSFATILPPSASHLPAHRRCDGRKFQTRSERQVIICHCWWGAALCASRCAPDSPPYMSIGGTAACDPPSCSVLWAHSQFHTEIKCCPSPCLSTDLLRHLRPW